jgi:hypothetical protein
MHSFVGLQQSADVVHFSIGIEHIPLVGMLEHTSAPPSPDGSQ